MLFTVETIEHFERHVGDNTIILTHGIIDMEGRKGFILSTAVNKRRNQIKKCPNLHAVFIKNPNYVKHYRVSYGQVQKQKNLDV